MLELANVDGFYGRSRALQSVSMTVENGDFFSVLGRNGVGKTTLLRTMLGLMSRTSGSIRLDGEELVARPTHERALAGLGYVPQGRGILPGFTVRENLMVGTFAAKGGGGRIAEWVLDLFPILKEFLNRRGGNLSGGQQQQLAIARALLSEPKVMLLDEPTEGIQPNIVAEIGQTLGRLNKEFGITLILTEQHIKVARKLGDAFLMMENGRIVARGPISEMTDELIERHMTI